MANLSILGGYVLTFFGIAVLFDVIEQQKKTMAQQLTIEWQNWVLTNLERGVDPIVLSQTMQQKGFELSVIKQILGDKIKDKPVAVMASKIFKDKLDPKLDYQQLANISITKNEQAVKFDSKQIQVYQLDDFLTAEECNQIIDLMNTRLRPSTLTHYNGDDEFRTSQTCDLGHMDAPVVTQVENRIARTLGLNLAFSEVMQGQKYRVGEQFKSHSDYFEPGGKTYFKYAKDKGQRTWTFMIYLNDTPKGGGTCFTKLDQTYYPKTGTAVIWNNLYSTGRANPATFHQGMPVEEGEKFIITKWFRERGDGDIFDTSSSAI